MVGFNRRFDLNTLNMGSSVKPLMKVVIGTPEMAIITSRDPRALPAGYIQRSGGIFRDMTIHDFDMAIFLMGEMPETVQAISSVLTDPAIEPRGILTRPR